MTTTIGIVSPSAPISAFCPKRLQRGVDELQSLGFDVRVGKHVSDHTGFTAGTIADRVADIHEMFEANVDVIIATIGGYNANDLLDQLDYDLIRQHNDTLFVGYSDVTVLLHALHDRAGVQTILGPMILPQFAEFGGTLPFTKKSFLHVIGHLGSGDVYGLPIAQEWTEEFTPWDSEDTRPRVMESNNGWQVIQSGKARGTVMAANLRTLLATAGTPYFPDCKDAVLFLEDDEDEQEATVARMLQQLKHMGMFDQVQAIVFGRFQKKSQINTETMQKLCTHVGIPASIPVIVGVDFGHTDPMLSLPIGKQVSVSTEEARIAITL